MYVPCYFIELHWKLPLPTLRCLCKKSCLKKKYIQIYRLTARGAPRLPLPSELAHTRESGRPWRASFPTSLICLYLIAQRTTALQGPFQYVRYPTGLKLYSTSLQWIGSRPRPALFFPLLCACCPVSYLCLNSSRHYGSTAVRRKISTTNKFSFRYNEYSTIFKSVGVKVRAKLIGCLIKNPKNTYTICTVLNNSAAASWE